MSYKSWNKIDDLIKTMRILEDDYSRTLNTCLEYGFVLELYDKHIDVVNKANYFWAQVLCALRYTFFMGLARALDESNGAMGLKKILNKTENEFQDDSIRSVIHEIRDEYENKKKSISKIKYYRDRLLAHNDRKSYNNPDFPDVVMDDLLDDEVLHDSELICRWCMNALRRLRRACGDDVPIGIEILNDIESMFQ